MSKQGGTVEGRSSGQASRPRTRSSVERRASTSNGDGIGNRPARLRILDKEVQIACKPGEEEDLLQAAAYIDRSMRDLRQRNTTSSIEKIAIVTAINTAHALLKSRSQEVDSSTSLSTDHQDDIVARLATLNHRLDALLEDRPDDGTADRLDEARVDASGDNPDTLTAGISTDAAADAAIPAFITEPASLPADKDS